MTNQEKSDLLLKLDKALDDVRPHLAVDGGNVRIVDISPDMLVHIKWVGTCEGCSMSDMTLRAGIEQTLKIQFPQINGVIAINGTSI